MTSRLFVIVCVLVLISVCVSDFRQAPASFAGFNIWTKTF